MRLCTWVRLGYELPRHIFMEHTADQGVIGQSFLRRILFEGLQVELRETDGNPLRFGQGMPGAPSNLALSGMGPGVGANFPSSIACNRSRS